MVRGENLWVLLLGIDRTFHPQLFTRNSVQQLGLPESKQRAMETN
ncbi:hypothetical protein QUA35_22765 [Microcoleus sp. N9_B2]